jgi:hypothetical protein
MDHSLFRAQIYHFLLFSNPNKVMISQWGQWDLNPRPPAPQAYTSTELVSLTKLDDGPSKSENKGLLLNLKNA